jgi:hypothetical protein
VLERSALQVHWRSRCRLICTEGTTSNPKFIPDVGGVVGGLAKNELGNVSKAQVPRTKNITKTLGGVFGKKN